MHTFNPSTWEGDRQVSVEFEASSVYRVSSRTAKTVSLRNPVLKNQTKPKPKNHETNRIFPHGLGWLQTLSLLATLSCLRCTSAYRICLVLVFESKESKCLDKSELSCSLSKAHGCQFVSISNDRWSLPKTSDLLVSQAKQDLHPVTVLGKRCQAPRPT